MIRILVEDENGTAEALEVVLSKKRNTITYAKLDVYEYEGKPNQHSLIRTLTPAESIPYLADLIELEIVEVVE